jgi:enediyne biosynthesis protein E4
VLYARVCADGAGAVHGAIPEPRQSNLRKSSHAEQAVEEFRLALALAPLLFRNLGRSHFRNVTAAMGAAFNRPIVGRGAAYADFDRDGDLDLLISTNNGPAYLYRNDGGNRNHWLSVRLAGTKSNRDGIGSVVHVKSDPH